jgi:adenylosuccinate synthase
MGIGECRSDAERGLLLWVQDVLPHGFPGILQRIREDKLQEMEPMREAAPEEFARLEACSAAEIWEGYREILSKVRRSCWPGPKGTVVFEGSQGVLLDEYHGFAPYNTWVDTTFQWADGILNDDCGFSGKRERVGILRAYFTRHGPGPFPTEDASLAVPEEHNKANGWAGAFRVGRFDLELAQYAVERARPDCIALTHVDSPLFQPGMIEQIEKGIGVPVRYTSAGPCAKDKRVRKGE